MSRSRIFLYSMLSFGAGVAIASFARIPIAVPYVFVVLGTTALVVGIIEGKLSGTGMRNNAIVVSLCVCACALGVLRFHQKEARMNLASVRAWNNAGTVTVRGIVWYEPDMRETSTHLLVRALSVEDTQGVHNASGYVLAFVPRYPTYAYGDELVMRGVINAPEAFDNFDYPAYLAKDDIYSLARFPKLTYMSGGNGGIVHTALFRIKHMFASRIERVLPEPHAAFLEGLILGTRSRIPAELLDAFRRTGVTHIIALSGFNITIIAENISRFLRVLTLGPVWSFWVASVVILLFTILAGASASIVRAAIMGILVLYARKEGRQYRAVNALVCAGAVMVFQNPMIVRYDVGFQLSFLATLGLLYVSPRVEPWVARAPAWFGVRDNIVATLSAQIMVLPLLVFSFGTISLISPITNVLILSVIPITMFFGFVAGVASFASTIAGVAFGSVAYALLNYQIGVVELFSLVPYADVYVGTVSWVAVAVMYAALACWLWRR